MRIRRRVRRLRSAVVMRDWARRIWRLRISFLLRWASSNSFLRCLSSCLRDSCRSSSPLSSSCGSIAGDGSIDEHERANGQLYREVQFALPKELSEAERRELASGFAKRLTYTLAVHRGDGENPHAHLMISERGLDGVERDSETWFRRYNRQEPEKGGAHKSRAAMPKAWLEDTRKAWEREANEALERAGYGERIDHRSLAERRDAAERSGDLELAAELSRKAQCSSWAAGTQRVAGGAGIVCPSEGRAGEGGPCCMDHPEGCLIIVFFNTGDNLDAT